MSKRVPLSECRCADPAIHARLALIDGFPDSIDPAACSPHPVVRVDELEEKVATLERQLAEARNAALEEAAREVETHIEGLDYGPGAIAAAIRALKKTEGT